MIQVFLLACGLNILLFLPTILFNLENFHFIPNLNFSDFSWQGLYNGFLSLFIRREGMDLFRINLEVIASLLILQWIHSRYKRIVIAILAVWFQTLVFFETYRLTVRHLTQREAMLSEDLKLIEASLNFLLGLGYFDLILGLLTTLIVSFVVFKSIYGAFDIMADHLQRPRLDKALYLRYGCAFSYILLLLIWYGPSSQTSLLRSSSFQLTSMITDLNQEKQRATQQVEAPGRRLGIGSLSLKKKPNFHILVIESYGRFLQENERLAPLYQTQMQSMQQDLKRNGWQMASGFSKAPVFGGRSWLSIASMLSGQSIKQQTQWQKIASRDHFMPSLLRDLNRMGYQTIGSFPANKKLQTYTSQSNPFQFQTYIDHEALQYEGPSMNWNHIPDQYSLNFVYENYLSGLEEPYIHLWMGISSHAPWSQIPRFFDDWKEIQSSGAEPDSSGLMSTWQRIYTTILLKFFDQGLQMPSILDRYFASISYTLNTVQQYIQLRGSAEDIFIIIGDHQPLITNQKINSFDTPIHVITGPDIDLETLAKQTGLSTDARHSSFAAIEHHELTSLIARLILSANRIQDLEQLEPIATKPQSRRQQQGL